MGKNMTRMWEISNSNPGRGYEVVSKSFWTELITKYMFAYLLTHSLTHSLHGAGHYLKS